MINTTLCYIEKDNQYLMLYRNKKENDCNEGKWIGVGGKFEKGETAEACLKREVFEETGLTLTDYIFHGVVHFISDKWEAEDMYLFTGTAFTGEIKQNCDEGELRFVPKDQVLSLPTWAGDRFFLEKMLRGEQHINMTLSYKGDELVYTRGI